MALALVVVTLSVRSPRVAAEECLAPAATPLHTVAIPLSASLFSQQLTQPAAAQLPDPDDRLAVLQQWFDAVANHVPGENDRSLAAVASWSRRQLLFLRVDIDAVYALVLNPELNAIRLWSPDELRREYVSHFRTTRVVPFDGIMLTRMRPMAQRIQEAGVEAFSKRAALLHTDLLTLRNQLPSAAMPRLGESPSAFRVLGDDAQVDGVADASLHWDLARLLVARIAPSPTTWTRDWYRATVSHLLSDRQYGTEHLRLAVKLFARDASILLLAGAEHEARASPAVQAFVAEARRRLPVALPVMTRKRELEEAQRYFEEATQRAPGLIEARLRLGNVLAKVGPSGEAADHLRRATQDDAEPLLQYYAHLILGQMLTALGDRANAVLAYEKAGRIMPLARLPNLALAAAAARAGDDDARRRLLSRALSVDLDDQAEPWFSYSQSAGRHAGELLDSLRKSVAETRR